MAVIHFDKDHRIEVMESAAQIQKDLDSRAALFMTMLSLRRAGSEESVYVVASQIRFVSEPKRSE